MTNQERQLNQLKRLDPALATQAEAGTITPAEGLKMVVAGMQPDFDLTIASRKYGTGMSSQADNPVEWWQVAGGKLEHPKSKISLTDLINMGKLDAYVLVSVEVKEFAIVRRYVKKDRQDAPLRAARFARATHRSSLDPNEFYQETRTGAGTLSARWDGDWITEWKRFKAHLPEWAVRI